MIRALLGSFLRASASAQTERMLALSPPRGALQVHATGVDADRVLLAIDRPSIGPGAASQELGFAGHLVRQLSLLSGRGTDLDVLSNGDMTAADCLVALSAMDLSRFDAVVLMVGSSEALGLTRDERWASELGKLLDGIEAQAPAGMHTFVVAIAPVEAIIGIPRIFTGLVGANIRRLNAVSAEVCRDRDNASLLRFDAPPAPLGGRNTSASFGTWAALIAPAIYIRLTSANHAKRVESPVDEVGRQRALDQLNVLDTYGNPKIDRLVESTKNLFGTTSAAVTFLDRNRRFVKSAIGTPRDESPRTESFCDLAIAESGIFVIEDTHREPLMLSSAREYEDVRFYAGFPIEAPSGFRVGVLCIMDDHPRAFGPTESALLRNLALQIQAELWIA
jgi:hypothetical protein